MLNNQKQFNISDYINQLDNYDLIQITSTFPLQNNGLLHRGNLIKMNLEYNIYFNKITKIPFKFPINKLNIHFDKLNHLKNSFAPTRFSNEPKFDMLSVWLHKLKMIEIYSRKHSELSNIVFFKNSPIGCNICYLTQNLNILNLYELAIKPEGRNGYCAFNLLRQAVEMLGSTGISPNEVTTNVYENNRNSLKFFEAIGFKINSKTYHYNYWNESRNRK